MASAPKSMLIVAGHAIWTGSDWDGIEKSRFPDPAAMKRTIAQHVREGCRLGVNRAYDVVVFSGGQTRKGLELSEAQGMADFAGFHNLELPDEMLLETSARDSFENVFFSLLAFYQRYDEWPQSIGVISMPHKSIRFMLMAKGLKFDNLTFHGIGRVDPHDVNCVNEMNNMSIVVDCDRKAIVDPLLRNPYFIRKRIGRTGPDFNEKQSDKSDVECRTQDAQFLTLTASKYGDRELCKQICECDDAGGWDRLAWPWKP